MAKRQYFTEIGIRRRRMTALFWTVIMMLAAATVVILILLVLLRSPVFRVRSVVIQGNTLITNERIETVLRASVPGESKFARLLGMRNLLVWPTALSKDELKFLPEAKSVTISKNYFTRTITVHVSERERRGMWCFEKIDPVRCFWFDADGLINRTPRTEGSLIPVVNDYAHDAVEYGPLIRPEFLPNLFSIVDAVGQMPLTPKEIRFEDPNLQEIQVPTFDGPTLAFSLRFSATTTPAALRALSERASLSKLSSIDFRVEGRVYYK